MLFGKKPPPPHAPSKPGEPDADLFDPDYDPEAELGGELPIDGTLDLHTFKPSQATDVLREYIGACLERGLLELRVVHGKGTGAMRDAVHASLAKDPRVAGYRLAGPEAGGWGATLVALRPEQ